MAGGDFRPIFDGKSLKGWHAVPRLPVARYPGGPEPDRTSEGYRRAAATSGRWSVEDGAIVGRQETFGLGGYLVSEATFGDFELAFEARPDWPADTGIMLRATAIGSQGFQVLLDHRKSGNIGGFYGNGIGGFHAINFNVDAVTGADGRPTGLKIEDAATTIEPITPEKRAMLVRGATGEEFLRTWRWGEWNAFLIRVAGRLPRIEVAINGTEIAVLDAAAIHHPTYDAAAVAALLGPRGRIAFEVHDNDPRMGEARWGRTAACRWRNVRVREL